MIGQRSRTKLNLNIKQTDRLAMFETLIVKKMFKFAPFHYLNILMDAYESCIVAYS